VVVDDSSVSARAISAVPPGREDGELAGGELEGDEVAVDEWGAGLSREAVRDASFEGGGAGRLRDCAGVPARPRGMRFIAC
jgi:hypothetical protein